MTHEFDDFFNTHHQKLYTLAFRMTGNREDAEDVLQRSYLNAFQAYDSFAGRSSLYTWIYRIVMNMSKRFFKEARKLPAVEYAEEHGLSQEQVYEYINRFGQVEDNVLVSLTREACLQMFMNCMPPSYRAAYTLRVILGFSTAETAEILDITESLVKVNLHRARKLAQSHIQGRCSLIQPGAMCDCRSYAAYIKANKRMNWLCDIQVVQNKEKAAKEECTAEMEEILGIDSLYQTQIKAPDDREFSQRLKELVREKRLKLLGGKGHDPLFFR